MPTPDPTGLTVRPVTDARTWDATVLPLGAHPLQLWGWGQVKSAGAWTAHRVVVLDGERPVGGAQILVRALPWPLRGLSYLPRGPVVDEGADRSAVTRAVVDWAGSHLGGVGITLEPPWPVGTDLDLPGAVPATQRVLVPDTLIIDLTQTPEELLAAMRRSTRQRVRKGLKAPLEIREVDDDGLDAVLDVYHQVAARAGFALHSDAYYRRVRAELGPTHSPVLAAYHEGAPVAFMWLAAGETTAFELYAGGTDAGQRLDANYALKWSAWLAMKERGLRAYDLNGLLNDGISEFKRGFADHEDALLRAVDVPFSPLYRVWQVGAPAAKRVVSRLRHS